MEKNVRTKIEPFSKVAVELTNNTICYCMQYFENIYEEKNTIFFLLFSSSIVSFPIIFYKFDDSFFRTLNGFSIIFANIKGRIKIKFSMARALTKYKLCYS